MASNQQRWREASRWRQPIRWPGGVLRSIESQNPATPARRNHKRAESKEVLISPGLRLRYRIVTNRRRHWQASSSHSAVRYWCSLCFFLICALWALMNKKNLIWMMLLWYHLCLKLLSIFFLFYFFTVFSSKTTSGLLATSEQEIFCLNNSLILYLYRATVCLF